MRVRLRPLLFEPAKAALAALLALVWRGEPRVLLVLGHMRSGSSLLLHLLMSHPQVRGCGERNRRLASERDLDRLVFDACSAQRRWPRRGLVFADQLNHNRLLDAELLAQPRVFAVFLVREPEPTIASMVAVLGRHYGIGLDEAVDLVCERLEGLSALAEVAAPERSLALTYEQLTGNPGLSLRRLSERLGFDPPLEPRYQTFPFTGRRGDPSARILAGTVLPAAEREVPEISVDQRRRLSAAYSRCQGMLSRLESRARAQ